MSRFIANMIQRDARKSLEEGQEKYRAYFTRTSLYTPFKEAADAFLVVDGFADVIVSE